MVFDLQDLGSEIHELESEFDRDHSIDLEPGLNSLEEQMKEFLDQYRDLLKIDYTGRQQRFYSLSEEQFTKLMALGKELPASFQSSWVQLMGKLHEKDIGEICSNLEPSVARLAEKLGKKIDFKIFGAENKLDAERFQGLMKALVHAINNACDHGIESPYDRLSAEKDETGLVLSVLWSREMEN